MIRKFMKYNRYKTLLILMSFLIFSIISVLIMSHTHTLYSTADMHTHIRRLLELKEDISHKELLPLFSFNYTHGSAIMAMYPYISIIPFALLLLMIHSFILDYYIFIILIIYCTFIVSFFSSLNYNKSVKLSYMFALIYGMSSNMMTEAFITGDLGIATAFSVLPISIFGFLNLMAKPSNYKELAIGITLLLYCQVPATIIVIIFLIFWLVINYKIINIKLLKYGFKALGLFILLSGPIWIPLISLTSKNQIHTVSSTKMAGVGIKSIIENLGFIPIIATIIILFFIMRINKSDIQMYILSLIAIFMSCKLMPWNLITSIKPLNLFNNFQYGFRFLIIPQILLCYLLAIIITYYIKNSTKYKCVIALVILSQLASQSVILHHKLNSNKISFNTFHNINIFSKKQLALKQTQFYFSENRAIKYYAHKPINRDDYDYYPKRSMPYKSIINNSIAINNHNIKINNNGFNKFIFKNKYHLNKLVLPIVHYNGENIRLLLNNHQINSHINKYKLLTINNIPHGINKIAIIYQPNILAISLIIILFILGILWLYFF